MRGRTCAALALVAALAAAAAGAPPEVTSEIKAKPGQLVRVVVKGANTGYLRNFTDDEAFFGEMVSPVKGERHFVFQPPTDKPKGSYVLGFFTKGEDSGVATTIVVEGAVPAPPPKPIDPPPPDVVPDTGEMRVLFVAESSAKLTANQISLLNSTRVRAYLDGRCAKDAKGRPEWRLYDPQQAFAAGESATMKALFADAKPNLTGLPVVVVARGSTAKVYPITPTMTEPELLALFGPK